MGKKKDPGALSILGWYGFVILTILLFMGVFIRHPIMRILKWTALAASLPFLLPLLGILLLLLAAGAWLVISFPYWGTKALIDGWKEANIPRQHPLVQKDVLFAARRNDWGLRLTKDAFYINNERIPLSKVKRVYITDDRAYLSQTDTHEQTMRIALDERVAKPAPAKDKWPPEARLRGKEKEFIAALEKSGWRRDTMQGISARIYSSDAA
ncbi:hypothetical protein COY28_02385 [Candidatus Woesearchaeota archaeon CG_4_10_14_0_2_um_filter_57_5]|nr:MAG: hypothetical protein COY28_02385 [Candidatus Woesearchaeota archaeon CG_4_10_14_0_2_um_filter_57_5]